ncbi:MAG: type II secretion system protein N [Burkholderiaceae bacterium]
MNLLQLRHAHRAAFAVSVLAVLAVCAIVVHWTTVLLAPASPIAPVEVVADPRANADVRGAASLFGIGGAPSATGPTVTDIQVIGLAASRTRAAAILALDGKAPRAYAEGDTLSRGVRLVKVSEDEVVIERGGARQRLDVPARPSLSVLGSNAGRPRDGDGAISSPPGSPPPPPAVSPVPPPPPPAAPSPAPPARPAPTPTPFSSVPSLPSAAPPSPPPLADFPPQGGPPGLSPEASMPPPGIGGQPNPLARQMSNIPDAAGDMQQ